MLDRRTFLLRTLSLGAGLGVATGCRESSPTPASRDPAERVSLSEFVAAAHGLAHRLVIARDLDERGYLRALEALARSMRLRTEQPRIDDARVESEVVTRQHPLSVMVAQLGPGATLTTHDHRYYNAMLLVTAGTVDVETFTFVDGRPLDYGAPVRLRRVERRTLQPGDTATVSWDARNVHRVRTRGGGAFLDVFAKQRRGAFSQALALDDDPPDGDGIRWARWGERL